jgi:DNA invertase Pin-like site-specific DNA recombinase
MRHLDHQVATPRKALIYCRVSGKKQAKEGSGLSSQEHRCRQYAEAKGYAVERVFPDDVSGGGDFMKRKGMVALLRYLEDHPHERYVVIFDDLKRYARDAEFHLRLRRMMAERKATRECLNFNFEDSPEGWFNETIQAAAGELERLQLARQNRQKSIARVEQGYCVQSVPPVGYVYEKSPGGGKILVRDEPLASIVQDVLEGYANGRFGSAAEVARYLTEHPTFPKKGASGRITNQKATEILQRKLYAGIVGMPVWGVSDRVGKHKGLISVETHERILQKLDGRAYAPSRTDIREDFPLRGAVCCKECATPLTAGWSKGKYKSYPYYFCYKRECSRYGKTISKKRIEDEFQKLLGTLQPTKGLVRVATAMLRDLWTAQLSQAEAMAATLERDLEAMESKIGQVVDAAVEVTNPRVLAAYERRIEMMEREKLILREKALKSRQPPGKFEELLELSIQFLSSPRKIWETQRFSLQRLVLKLCFSAPLSYDRATGALEHQISLPFKAVTSFFGGKEEMVVRGRPKNPRKINRLWASGAPLTPHVLP